MFYMVFCKVLEHVYKVLCEASTTVAQVFVKLCNNRVSTL